MVDSLLRRSDCDPGADDGWAIKTCTRMGKNVEILKRLLQDSRVDPCCSNNEPLLNALASSPPPSSSSSSTAAAASSSSSSSSLSDNNNNMNSMNNTNNSYIMAYILINDPRVRNSTLPSQLFSTLQRYHTKQECEGSLPPQASLYTSINELTSYYSSSSSSSSSPPPSCCHLDFVTLCVRANLGRFSSLHRTSAVTRASQCCQPYFLGLLLQHPSLDLVACVGSVSCMYSRDVRCIRLFVEDPRLAFKQSSSLSMSSSSSSSSPWLE
eukprot:TRINITY_DN8360_c0_g1_i2.p1 TRINITY_DN8360_c0_g1~~TRINITY_DN8360_c0_g1_i2.p1  ORF type:complete len:268 (+),score=65.25 TRINITY_DN8360_c0_g1_i2:1118-1921(+)